MKEKTDKIIGAPGSVLPKICSKCETVDDDAPYLCYWSLEGKPMCANCMCERFKGINDELVEINTELNRHASEQLTKLTEERVRDAQTYTNEIKKLTDELKKRGEV